MSAANTEYVGYVDFVTNNQVVGWAVTTKEPRVSTFVNIIIDDVLVATVECRRPREDVQKGGYSAPMPGFVFDIPPEFKDGELHRLKVEFLNSVPLQFAGSEAGRIETLFRSVQEFVFKGYVERCFGDIISGWVAKGLSESGPWFGNQDVAIYCGKELAGQIQANEPRPDVAAALSSDAACGFSFQIPHRFLSGCSAELRVETFPQRWVLQGSRAPLEPAPALARVRLKQMQVRLDSLIGEAWHIQREIQALTAASPAPLASYDSWAVHYFNNLRRRATDLEAAQGQPLVSIICPVYRPRLADFVTAVKSVRLQTYPHWELILIDDNSQQPELDVVMGELAEIDQRIRIVRHTRNLGISEATNTGIRAARGEFVAFFDHDDALVDVALQYSVSYLLRHNAAVVYSDEDKIDDSGRLSEPNLKPDWNLRLVLAQNYVCHFLVVRRDIIDRVGAFRSQYDGAQDHDYVMRLSEQVSDSEIVHIPEVLYHWRKTPGSTASTVANKQYAIDAGVKAVQHHLDRTGARGKVRSRGNMTNYVIEWDLGVHPHVSVIIPFKDNVDLTRRCVTSVLTNTDYANFGILLVSNYSMETSTNDFILSLQGDTRVRIVNADFPFNYSLINNIAVQTCNSEVIALLNNDVFISDPTWLSQMVGELLWRADVGAVGCKLLYETGTIQHAGVILGVGDSGVAEHAYRGLDTDDTGYIGRAVCSQELSAVTGACLVCKKSLFDEVGGFDSRELPVAFNDVDLCLKMRALGYRIVWRAETIATHAESASRPNDMDAIRLPRFLRENRIMKERWGRTLAHDPYYHRLFYRERGIFQYLVQEDAIQPH